MMLSLYDYLGYAAGSELGELVYSYAKLRKVKVGSRQVETSKYKGKVLLYNKEFLDETFKTQDLFVNKITVNVNRKKVF